MKRVKTQASLAKALGVSRATISKYVDDGLRPERDGTFDVEKGRRWHEQAVDRTKAGTSRTSLALTFDERYRKAKAIGMEKELAVQLGELVSRAEVKREWSMQLLQIRDGFLYLGREVAPQLVGRSAREIQATIDARVMQILGQLSAEPQAVAQ
jgi:predicted transcriptional regulator